MSQLARSPLIITELPEIVKQLVLKPGAFRTSTMSPASLSAVSTVIIAEEPFTVTTFPPTTLNVGALLPGKLHSNINKTHC